MNIFLTESRVEDPKLMVGADFLVEKTCLPVELPLAYWPAQNASKSHQLQFGEQSSRLLSGPQY